FKDRKFTGTVTEIANSSKNAGLVNANSGSTQEATKFEVKIRIKEKEPFRPGMSVTADIETRSRTNVLSVPIASVTTRLPKNKGDTNCPPDSTNGVARASNNPAPTNSETSGRDKKSKEAPKPIEVVFLVNGDHVKAAPVKIGISDDSYWEITE